MAPARERKRPADDVDMAAMYIVSIALRPRNFGPWWLQQLLGVQSYLVQFDLDIPLRELPLGAPSAIEILHGSTPDAPGIMERDEATLTSTSTGLVLEHASFSVCIPYTPTRFGTLSGTGMFTGKGACIARLYEDATDTTSL